MPNRDLHEQNRRSQSLQVVSDATERLWYRLITAVDDFGRLEADPEVVFTSCFQRVPKGWTAEKVERCLQELSLVAPAGQTPMVRLYTVGSKTYLQINSAESHIYRRAKKSKYPDPPPEEPSRAAVPRSNNDAGKRGQARTKENDSQPPGAERQSEFWASYPARNGKKLYKAQTFASFSRLSDSEQQQCIAAAKAYARHCRETDRIPKDPHRFLKGRDGELWRDFIPAEPAHPSQAPASDQVRTRELVEPPEEVRTMLRKIGRPIPITGRKDA